MSSFSLQKNIDISSPSLAGRVFKIQQLVQAAAEFSSEEQYVILHMGSAQRVAYPEISRCIVMNHSKKIPLVEDAATNSSLHTRPPPLSDALHSNNVRSA